MSLSIFLPYRKSLIMALVILLAGAGLQSLQAQSHHARQDLQSLERLLNSRRYLKFRMVSERDPYQNSYRIVDRKSEAHYLALSSDGRYVEYSAAGETRGTFRINYQQPTLRLQQEATRSATAGAYAFQVRQFDGRRLVLGWQGRHGYVERDYVLIEAPR